MTLKIYNSLTKCKQDFKPITPGEIKIYVCGITVYDYCHIGHARSMVTFDMITRYLRTQNYTVIYARNITDIDDKIIHRALQQSESSTELANRFITAMHEDERALQILPPDFEPKATEHVSNIITLVQQLLANNTAYRADNGDICFAVRKFKDYGKLSNRNLDDLIAGSRVEITEGKRDPLDFVLWKLAKPNEPAWPSPWGDGRPGWHIECSAMASHILGQPFDIHGGGLDLKFPHHENEIAQSEAAQRQPFANYWLHVGLLQIDNEKMSKSLNNFITIRDALQQYSSEEIRYFMLSSHYRSPVSYSTESMTKARRSLTTLYTAIRDLPTVAEAHMTPFNTQFHQAMHDDFNSPEALAVLFEVAHEINRLREQTHYHAAGELAAGLKRLASIFGILQQSPDAFFQGTQSSAEINQIEILIAQRNHARQTKDWHTADLIRQQLAQMGIVIEDHAGETSWRKL